MGRAELKQAHANVLCIAWYNDRRRRHNRWYHLFIAVVASSSSFGYLLNNNIPLIGTITIAIVSVAKSIFPQFLQPEHELSELDKIMDYYNKYASELECLLYKFDQKYIQDQEVIDTIHKMKVEESLLQSKMNRLVYSIPQKRLAKIENDSTNYLGNVYLDKYEER
jgi:hypothetical protein